jgi:hypothetical protein
MTRLNVLPAGLPLGTHARRRAGYSRLTLTLGGARTVVSPGIRPDDEAVSVEEISIGEFVRRSRVSLKALRLYDEISVLVPSRVDEVSGYRYYYVTQLDEARQHPPVRSSGKSVPPRRADAGCSTRAWTRDRRHRMANAAADWAGSTASRLGNNGRNAPASPLSRSPR